LNDVKCTCPGCREKANPSTMITTTPIHDFSLSVLSAVSKARYTIAAINGNRDVIILKYL
jgi:hypothetical protein